MKKQHSHFKKEFLTLKEQHWTLIINNSSLGKAHTTLVREHESILDEFDSLNK